jgi:anthranilate synthase component 2/para-aminobenzoate synthetase component 2
MFLVIDNYDSFVHNLARYVEIAGGNTEIVRNDAITIEDIRKMNPTGIVLSPGPCTPKQAGICVDLIKAVNAKTPILGVCLGHQAIGEAYGGKTTRTNPMHGKSSAIAHDGSGVFKGLPSPLNVGRYHSLQMELPEDSTLIITAKCGEEIMGVRHLLHPIYGVQFHPESVLTQHGQTMIDNFVNIAQTWHKNKKKKKAA